MSDLTKFELPEKYCEATSNSLTFKEDTPYEVWEKVGSSLKKVGGAIQLWLGDWLNFGERVYGEKYSQALEDTHYEYTTLREFASIAGRTADMRKNVATSPQLLMGHWDVIADLPQGKQEKWVKEVADNNLTIKELRESVRKDKTTQLIARGNEVLPTNIKLLEGDVFDKIKEIEDKSIDLLVTDPPYFMNKADWDSFESKDKFLQFTTDWLMAMVPKLKESYNIFISFNSDYFADLEIICRDLGLPIQSRLIWHYRNAGGKSAGKFKFSKTYEPILHIGNKELNFGIDWNDERFDVWTIAVPQSNFDEGKFHPTQKPLELFKRLVELGSLEGELVADIFAGSGTTGLACKELNRSCVMIEKEAEYIKVIKNRL